MLLLPPLPFGLLINYYMNKISSIEPPLHSMEILFGHNNSILTESTFR